MASQDLAYERGLPSNIDAERFILGSIMMQDQLYIHVRAVLEPEDFSLMKHRYIFARMGDLADDGSKIDRVTVANELIKHGELEACDGLSYLVTLDEGLPEIANLDSYVKIVKEKSLLRRLILTGQQIIQRSLKAEEDPQDILESAEETLLKLGEYRATEAFSNPGQIIREFEGGLDAFLDPSKRIRGLSTGFVKLDELTGGLHSDELIILAGRPSMGKTALALNIAQHIAANPHNEAAVAVFSLEMSKESLLTRVLCARARVDQGKFRAGYLNQEERRALQMAATEMVGANLYIDDTAGLTLMDLHAKLRKLKNQHGLGLVVVDYLQLMSGRGRFENRNQEISALSRGMKLLAKELKVPMLVLSQLSRAPETRPGDHRPQLSDLRESGSIEQDADLVLFIFREEVYKRDREDLRGLAELIIGKQRNGPIGKVPLVFLREFTKFENRIGDLDEEAPPD